MDLRFLRTLHLVAQSGSMAQAARTLEISPAAVVHQVRSLEQSLNARLVTRSGRSVVPTQAGHRLLNSTRALLAQFDEAMASVHGTDMTGELKLGSINSALHSLIPGVLARYAADHPKVKLRVQADISPSLFQLLQDDVIDVAICQHPPFDLPKAFRWVLLKEEPLVVFAHKDHACRAPIELMQNEAFIRYSRQLAGGKQADAYIDKHSIAVREIAELDSLVAISLMVHRGLGVSCAPHFSSTLTASLDITALPLADAPIARRFGLLWKTATPRRALVQALSDYARLEANSTD